MSTSNSPVRVFIDESGDHNLDTTKTKQFFSLAAVVVQDQHQTELESCLLGYEDRWLGGKPVKSSKIGIKHRAAVFEELFKIPFRLYTFIIDKDQIFKDKGLSYGDVFRKKGAEWLTTQVANDILDCEFVFDSYGREKFMYEFAEFIRKKAPTTLFSEHPVSWADSKTTPMIRVADLICGTLRLVAENPSDVQYAKLLKLISSRGMPKIWPRPTDTIDEPGKEHGPTLGQLRLALERRVARFLQEFQADEDDNRKRQCKVLVDLQSEHYFFPGGDEWVSTARLRNLLTQNGLPVQSDQIFRRVVLGPIRDEGVIIASSSKGIKLASTWTDIDQYLNLTSKQIVPQLKRVKKAADVVYGFTGIGRDILDRNEYKQLRHLVDALNEGSLQR